MYRRWFTCLTLFVVAVLQAAGRAGEKDVPPTLRVQVRSLLGTPMVADPFEGSRWDYMYYLRKGHLGEPERRHFVVFFDGDKVARIERPTQAAPAS